MTLQKQFAEEVAAFLRAKDMKPTVFGREAMGDPSFVFQLEKGRAPNLRTIERARAFMASMQGDAESPSEDTQPGRAVA